MSRLETASYQEIGLQKVLPVEVDRRAGYLFNSNLIHGLFLVSQRNAGKLLLIRLKDSEGALLNEIEFWAGAMASMLDSFTGFDCVSYPPSSEKRSYYLARKMAEVVAKKADLPIHEHYKNNHPRRNRAKIYAKLAEIKDYSFIESEGACQNILMVDDAISTRKTADACISAAGNRSLFWLFLYASKSN